MADLTYSKTIETHDAGGLAVDLLCPRCRSGYLHHRAVVSFDRREDELACVVTTVRAGQTTVKIGDNRRNPSMRRDGLAIEFDCEGCGDGIEMTIAQHKGFTEIGWRFTPAPGV